MRAAVILILMAGMALGQARDPGDFYAGAGTGSATNPPYARGLTVYGTVNTNDVMIFLDRTGSKGRGTNLLGQLTAAGTNWQASVTAEALARAAGDAVAQTNLQAAIDAEAAARAAGDLVAMTNWQAVVYSLTNGAALGATALQAEADALQTVTDRGAVTTNEITALRYLGGRFGPSSGDGASGNNWSAIGYYAGQAASGNDWSAMGSTAGIDASGNNWVAVGVFAGQSASGNDWSAMGYYTGMGARHTNSFSIGHYSGETARGNNRGYFDVYASEVYYGVNGATNDRIFLENDGTLHLGRGGGAPGGAVGGTLRGPWTGGGFAKTNEAAMAVSAHNTNTASHADIRAEIAAIPTNVVGGWLVWDEGSNVYWRVTATNLRFYVWGSEP